MSEKFCRDFMVPCGEFTLTGDAKASPRNSRFWVLREVGHERTKR